MAFAHSRIALRIALPAILFACGLVGLFYYQQARDSEAQRSETRDVYAELVNRMVLSDLRADMLSKDRDGVQAELERFAGMEPIRSLRIVNKQGKVVFATDRNVLGTVMKKTDPSCVTCHQPGITPQRRARAIRLTAGDGTAIYRAVQPILLDEDCTACHAEKAGAAVGVLLTDLDDAALTGREEAHASRTIWGVVLAVIALFAVLAAALGRTVVVRLRHLRHLLDLLRTGARATVLSVGKADEIDEVTRAVQALTLDLDGRIAQERANRRLSAVLEGHPGPVLLLDARGWIVAGNRLAAQLFGGTQGVLAGTWPQANTGITAERLRSALEVGWSLPAEGEEGPAFMALTDPSGEAAAVLALWLSADVPAIVRSPAHQAAGDAGPSWQMYATVLAESSIPAHQSGSTVLRFDLRLGRVRRLAADMAALGREALVDREEVDLQSLAAILLWDLKREWPDVRWHALRATTTRAVGVRYQLRELMTRLAQAAARQAGPRGQVVLFAHETPHAVFLAAWANQPGGQAVLDGADVPALARAIAVSHGGGVEVDPAFDMAETPGFDKLKLVAPAIGTLYVAELALQGGPRPPGRNWHEPAMRD